MNSGRQDDYYPKQSFLTDGIDKEFLLDELADVPTKETRTLGSGITSNAGPLIPDSVTISRGENEVCNFVNAAGVPMNIAQVGGLEPQITISYLNPIETRGPSSFQENERPVSLTSFCPNPPSFAVLRSSHEAPSSNQVYLESLFAFQCHGKDIMHSNKVSSSHRSHLPLVDTSSLYPAQSFRNQNFHQTESTGMSSFGQMWDLVKTSSFLQNQPSTGNSSLLQWETSFGALKEDQNFSVMTTNTDMNTAREFPAVCDQLSLRYSTQGSGCQHSTSRTLAGQFRESRSQSYSPTALKPVSFHENEQPISLTSLCQNPPSFARSRFYQSQQSSDEIPSSNEVYLESPFAVLFHEENIHSNEVSSSHRSHLPLVNTPNFYPSVQSFGNQNFDETVSTSISSYGQRWDLIEASSFHQDQPSIGNSSSHQWATSFGAPRENQNFSDGITANTNTPHDDSPTVYGQPSIGLSFPRSSCEYSTSSTKLARQSCESRWQFNYPTVSTLQSEADISGQVFCKSDNLESHSSTNADEKSFECSVCPKKLKEESSLKGHSHFHNTVRKLFECDRCDRKFFFNYLLKIHYRVHSEEKPYKCSTCGAEYAQLLHLKRHYMVHSGEKPYKCDTCGKEFTQHANLKTHYKVHSGEKPYGCDTCGKTFTSKRNLDAHYHTHTEEKPFKCNICGKAYSCRKSLERHHASHPRERRF